VRPRILFVDDDPNVTAALKRSLRSAPYNVVTAEGADEALKILATVQVDVVVSDERMPGMSGSELLSLVCRRYPETIRIILTGQASLEAAIRAINQGEIYRFFTKPCNEIDLAVTIRQALQQKELLSERHRLLELIRNQTAQLEQLERVCPGITGVQKDDSGSVLIPSESSSFEQVVQQMRGGSAPGAPAAPSGKEEGGPAPRGNKAA